ncbi:hypothetical protein O3M35_000786 [Rhynocoris fuscipes]|uniref:Uncharacterized protein n=1 Tax=Rhynocoris fuscipes TaxID=488301 RepID=A0AAW1DMZ6_9HEMI
MLGILIQVVFRKGMPIKLEDIIIQNIMRRIWKVVVLITFPIYGHLQRPKMSVRRRLHILKRKLLRLGRVLFANGILREMFLMRLVY